MACAGLHQVSGVGVMRPARAHLETGDPADVEIVREAFARRRLSGELATIEFEFGKTVVPGENPVLVVDEAAAPHAQPSPLETNAGAVATRNARAVELHPVDVEAPLADHPDRLAFGGSSVGEQAYRATDRAYRQKGLQPDCGVATIVARVDLDRVSAARDARGLRRDGERTPGTDAVQARTGIGIGRARARARAHTRARAREPVYAQRLRRQCCEQQLATKCVDTRSDGRFAHSFHGAVQIPGTSINRSAPILRKPGARSTLMSAPGPAPAGLTRARGVGSNSLDAPT